MNATLLEKFIQGGGHRALSDIEKATINSIKSQSFAAVKNLGGRAEADVRNIINAETSKRRSKYEKILREKLSTGVINRESVSEMTRNLGMKTGDWERDLGRLIATESHNAYEEGRSSELTEKHGADVLVYKDVYSGACSSCIKAYLTGGINSEPKIFKLSELRANGTNIGKKQSDWLPTIGAIHPNCRCTLNRFEKDTKWNSDKRMYVKSDKYVQKYDYNITIKIGGKDYKI